MEANAKTYAFYPYSRKVWDGKTLRKDFFQEWVKTEHIISAKIDMIKGTIAIWFDETLVGQIENPKMTS